MQLLAVSMSHAPEEKLQYPCPTTKLRRIPQEFDVKESATAPQKMHYLVIMMKICPRFLYFCHYEVYIVTTYYNMLFKKET